jgi:hypothetical protein
VRISYSESSWLWSISRAWCWTRALECTICESYSSCCCCCCYWCCSWFDWSWRSSAACSSCHCPCAQSSTRCESDGAACETSTVSRSTSRRMWSRRVAERSSRSACLLVYLGLFGYSSASSCSIWCSPECPIAHSKWIEPFSSAI